jgi:hypothetical protein
MGAPLAAKSNSGCRRSPRVPSAARTIAESPANLNEYFTLVLGLGDVRSWDYRARVLLY